MKRIHAIAKEANKSSQEILQILQLKGYSFTSSNESIDEITADALLAELNEDEEVLIARKLEDEMLISFKLPPRNINEEFLKFKSQRTEEPDIEHFISERPAGAHPNQEHWQAIRKLAHARDGSRCVLCNSGKNLDVHHRTYERWGKEELSDVSTLCRDCHKNFSLENKSKRDLAEELEKHLERKICNSFLDRSELKFYSNKKRKSEKHYVGGYLDGVIREWFSSGGKKCEINYKAPGRSVIFVKRVDGAVEFRNKNEDVLDGSFQEWFSNKNIKVKTNFTNGLLNGEYSSYHSNGNRHVHTEFVMGKMTKGYREWDKNKNLKKEIKTENNIVWSCKKWNEKGVLIENSTFVHDNQKEFKIYHDNGSLKKIGSYTRGNLHGWVSAFDSEGNLSKKKRYRYGKSDNREEFGYFKNGKIKYHKKFVSNELAFHKSWEKGDDLEREKYLRSIKLNSVNCGGILN